MTILANKFVKHFALLLVFVSITLSCDTALDPPEVKTTQAIRLDNLFGTWKLIGAAASINGGVLKIDDLFDPTKNPQAAQVVCIKNSLLEIRRGGTFSETAICYGTNGNTATEIGTYTSTSTATETVVTFSYDKGAAAIPSKVCNIDDLINGTTLKMTFNTTQQGFNLAITYTYERQ